MNKSRKWLKLCEDIMAGRRIDDHSSWVGKGSEGSVLPKESKTMQFQSSEGAGGLGVYSDTTEAIKRDQDAAKSKLKSQYIRGGRN